MHTFTRKHAAIALIAASVFGLGIGGSAISVPPTAQAWGIGWMMDFFQRPMPYSTPPPSQCGDGICHQTENAGTCSQDCGAAAIPQNPSTISVRPIPGNRFSCGNNRCEKWKERGLNEPPEPGCETNVHTGRSRGYCRKLCAVDCHEQTATTHCGAQPQSMQCPGGTSPQCVQGAGRSAWSCLQENTQDPGAHGDPGISPAGGGGVTGGPRNVR